MGTMIAIVLLLCLHLAPAGVNVFELKGANSVTFTRQKDGSWVAKGQDPSDDGVFTVSTNSLTAKSKGYFGNSTITPDTRWGLRPDTKWESVTHLELEGDTIAVTKNENGITFTLQQTGEKAQTMTATWKR